MIVDVFVVVNYYCNKYESGYCCLRLILVNIVSIEIY